MYPGEGYGLWSVVNTSRYRAPCQCGPGRRCRTPLWVHGAMLEKFQWVTGNCRTNLLGSLRWQA